MTHPIDVVCGVRILNKELHGDRCLHISGNDKSLRIAIEVCYESAKVCLGQFVSPEQIERISDEDFWGFLVNSGCINMEFFGDEEFHEIRRKLEAAKDSLDEFEKNGCCMCRDNAERFVSVVEECRVLYDGRDKSIDHRFY